MSKFSEYMDKNITPIFEELYNKGEEFRNWTIEKDKKIGDKYRDQVKSKFGMDTEYKEQARKENEQYWQDYQKNTGIEPKYPILAGEQWDPSGTQGPMLLGTGAEVAKKLYGGMK